MSENVGNSLVMSRIVQEVEEAYRDLMESIYTDTPDLTAARKLWVGATDLHLTLAYGKGCRDGVMGNGA